MMPRILSLALLPLVALAQDSPTLRSQLEKANQHPLSQIEIIRRILESNPEDANTLRRQLIELWLQAGDPTMALHELSSLKDPPPQLSAIVKASHLASTPDKIPQAITLLQTHLQHHPDSQPALTLLAELLKKNHRDEELSQILATSTLVRKNPQLLILHAQTLRHLGKLDEALHTAKIAISQFPSSPIVRQEAPSFERLEALLPKLRNLETQLQKDPDNFALWVSDAWLASETNLTTRAKQSSLRALKLAPDSLSAQLVASLTLPDSDLARFPIPPIPKNKIPVSKPPGLSALDAAVITTGSADALVHRAQTLASIGLPDLAIHDVEAALALSPNHTKAHLIAVQAECSLGDPWRAKGRLTAAQLAKIPTQELANAALLVAKTFLHTSYLEAALQTTNLALELNPTPEARSLRAEILQRLGTPEPYPSQNNPASTKP